ncbi:alpha/beta fold hydrolase [Actibacterium ureilyticum]|uniref:alpha/beta fold hydrolase n=1 Tax=Actibacterium ureilyticum TaxID=1590614 RepID=UPI000BAB0D9A|nr:alpha/beta hydrolase [Actibacterium ureilyticum]
MNIFTTPDGAKLAFTDTGSGQPLLCLAGLTRNSADFDYVAPHLGGVRMICMDYRGRGASDWTGADTYTVAQEAQDALALLDHLGIERAAILGTSRGGLIGMGLAASVPDRIAGLCLNDVGPVLERGGLERIFDYVGRNPSAPTHAALAEKLPAYMPGFANVPPERWLSEVQHHYDETADGLVIRYDPALRDSFLAAFQADIPDAWPLYDTIGPIPLAVIRGANSDLLSAQTVAEMARRRPDLIHTDVPDRAHVPFLDEPESLTALNTFLEQIA